MVDNMKKMLKLLIVGMLIISTVSISYADESEGSPDNQFVVDSETQNQLEIMNYNLGSEIRLLQLEKSTLRNILRGEEILIFLNETEVNTSDIKSIIFEMEILLEEIQTADKNSTNRTQIFVDLKNDAIDLSKELRDTLRVLLDDETLENLRERLREMVCDPVQNLSKKIRNEIRNFNYNQFRRIFNIIGHNNESLLNNFKNNNTSLKQVKQHIQKVINQMTKERRRDIFSIFKQSRIQNQIKAIRYGENASDNFQERQEERLKNRLRKSENMNNNPLHDEFEKRIRNRLNNGGSDNNSSGDNNKGNGDNGNKQQSGGGGN